MDPEHHLYEAGSAFEGAIRDYYVLLDGRVGRLLDMTNDDTVICLVSDHGAKRMKGAFCINEWLIEKGYLVLNSYPNDVSRFEELDVDWSRFEPDVESYWTDPRPRRGKESYFRQF